MNKCGGGEWWGATDRVWVATLEEQEVELRLLTPRALCWFSLLQDG